MYFVYYTIALPRKFIFDVFIAIVVETCECLVGLLVLNLSEARRERQCAVFEWCCGCFSRPVSNITSRASLGLSLIHI